MNGAGTFIKTGAGRDTLVLGSFGRGRDDDPQNWQQDSTRIHFEATVTDFMLGSDRIRLFGRVTRDSPSIEGPQSLDPDNWLWGLLTLTQDDLRQFVKETSPIDGGNGTKLVVDLDGIGPGVQTYTLNLQSVVYNPNNTHTLFGV